MKQELHVRSVTLITSVIYWVLRCLGDGDASDWDCWDGAGGDREDVLRLVSFGEETWECLE